MSYRVSVWIAIFLFMLMRVAPVAAQSASCDMDGFRLVEHDLLTQPLCVPANPERIVAAHLNAFEIMLMLGIQPVARASDDFLQAVYGGAPPVYERVIEIVGDAPVYGSGTVDVNTEVLLSVQPDLVIAYQGMPNIDQLREFTTVVESPIAAFQPSRWSELGELFALVMGVEDEYAMLLAEYEERIKTFRELVKPEFDGASLVYLQNTAAVNFIAFPGMPLWETIADGGFIPVETLPTTAEDALAAYGALVIPLNDEMLSTVNADIIIMVNGNVRQDDRTTSDEIIASFTTNPLWQTLRAVQNGQLYAKSVYWQSNGLVSAHSVVDDFFVTFAGVDPAQVAPNPFLATSDTR
jgi:iron complex transport system substrate-binding protein